MSVQGEQIHGVTLNERSEMHVTGVTEVESFDDTAVSLRTRKGDLTVEGVGLRVGVLDVDRGVVSLSGRIDGLYYSVEEDVEKKSWLRRLLR